MCCKYEGELYLYGVLLHVSDNDFRTVLRDARTIVKSTWTNVHVIRRSSLGSTMDRVVATITKRVPLEFEKPIQIVCLYTSAAFGDELEDMRAVFDILEEDRGNDGRIVKESADEPA